MEVDRAITIVILLFVTLILIFYLDLPKYNAFQDILTEVGKKDAEFKGKNAYYIEVTSVYKELELYEDSLKKMETALPEKFALSPLINLIYKEATGNGIIIQRIGTGKIASASSGVASTSEISITLNIIGEYLALEKFLSALEDSARLIEGETVSFSVEIPTKEKPQPSKVYPVNLEIKVHSYNPS